MDTEQGNVSHEVPINEKKKNYRYLISLPKFLSKSSFTMFPEGGFQDFTGFDFLKDKAYLKPELL